MKISYRYLIDPDETYEAVSVCASKQVIGLDTETFWDSNSRKNQLSLLQIAAPSGEVLVIDALAAGIEQARSLIEDSGVLMVAHNARFDDGVLKGYGFKPEGLVDTLRLARRALPLKSFSLASVSLHLFGTTLEKTYQRSDWRRRPLLRAQLDYAALDAQIVLQVYDALSVRLKDEGNWEKELARARLDWRPKPQLRKKRLETDPIFRPLTAEERKLLETLQDWRSQEARSIGLPSYFVCQEKTLEHLVLARPQRLEELSGIFGLGPARIARYGIALLEKLRYA